jgi:hypothetical protein
MVYVEYIPTATHKKCNEGMMIETRWPSLLLLAGKHWLSTPQKKSIKKCQPLALKHCIVATHTVRILCWRRLSTLMVCLPVPCARLNE